MGEENLGNVKQFKEELDVSHPVLLAVMELFGVSIRVLHTYTMSETSLERMFEMFEAIVFDGDGNTLCFFDPDRNLHINVLVASCKSAKKAENELAEALRFGPMMRSDAMTVEIPEFRTIPELRMKARLRGGDTGNA